MTGSPASVSVLALAGCLAGASLLFAVRPSFAQAAKALGQSRHTGSSVVQVAAEAIKKSPSFEFDIPAQPLAAALDRYAVITGSPVLFPSKLVAGRSASAVGGSYEVGVALEMLLQGTGLGVEQLHEGGLDTFVLKLLPGQDAGAAAISATARHVGENADLENYDALVQARVWEALCSNTRTVPGSYRALLRFRVDGDGRVRQPRLLSSTGDKRRDAMLTDVLGKIVIAQPPLGLPQPLTMLILPQDQIAGRPCRTEAR